MHDDRPRQMSGELLNNVCVRGIYLNVSGGKLVAHTDADGFKSTFKLHAGESKENFEQRITANTASTRAAGGRGRPSAGFASMPAAAASSYASATPAVTPSASPASTRASRSEVGASGKPSPESAAAMPPPPGPKRRNTARSASPLASPSVDAQSTTVLKRLKKKVREVHALQAAADAGLP